MSRPPADDWAEDQTPGEVHAEDLLGETHHDETHHGETHHDELFPEEHDESLAHDVLQGPPEGHDDFRPRRPEKHHNPLLRIGAIVVAAAVVIVGGIIGFNAVRGMIPDLSFGSSAPEDFEGEGSGEVTVEIPQGAGGGQIGQILFDAGVVASAEGFANTAAADPRATGIQPGTYLMSNEMSSAAALERLVDPEARQVAGVTIREGLWTAEVFALLADATGNDVADYEAIDPASLNLPEAANGELEGYLWPDTYEFGQDSTPEEQLQAMLDLGAQRYADLGLEPDAMHDIIIKASIVQGEGLFAEDLPKIARVVENRLKEGSETDGKLQMDSTIHFIHQQRGLAGTTKEQREDESPYNTYLHQGLPPGPINSPGAAAIEAAMNPAEGDWEYFVTVNPDTGETVFTNSYEEHQEYEAEFLQWCEDNPDRC
ncbi:endolytic transglycosylase MltG [Ornithinimicrobium faecis]|uniref:Endolytic murein transglycosylase n=1 Tax=Ornithinimicrobium faecis TaxID=2934158 RepID=A0ABY4YNH9_9MICO|nr:MULTISPECIES: endolytic transglycosylase MltG [unclassified Ornithinimicrobium]USQ78356.1 endolytic transglycosylase MltG [Ornithinimicrobium sp. HY1793]